MIRLGGGREAIERQHEKGRKTARERIAAPDRPRRRRSSSSASGPRTGCTPSGAAPVGRASSRASASSPAAGVMIVANDATVKAGAFFPMTIKKVLRAQAIAGENRLPLVYLVDSSGVFLPMQDEVFPDEDDFGRIFRNNAVLSAQGIPQFAAIMGNCVAGGAYLPVLCDTLLMTEGSGLYLAGPALVKAAIGQDITHEDLGGAGDARRDQRHRRLPRAGRRRRASPACAGSIGLLPPADPSGRCGRRSSRPPRPADDLFEIVQHRPVGAVRRPRPARGAWSTAAGSTSTGPSTARRSSAASPGSAGCRSGSWPTSGCGSGPRRAARSSSAA